MARRQSIDEVEAFWKKKLPATFDPMRDSIDREVAKELDRLPPDLSLEIARKVYSFYLGAAPHYLWRTLAKTPDTLVETLVACLRKSSRVQARTFLAAFERGGADALRETGAFFRAVHNSNVEPMLRRLPGLNPGAAFAQAAAEVVATTRTIDVTEFAEFWGLAWVAAHARPELVDELEARASDLYETQVPAWIFERVRATPREAKPKKEREPSLLPASVAEVKKWLAAHPDVDPAVFVRRDDQTTGEKAAAIRALTSIGTPAALEVLTSYRPKGAEIWGLSFPGKIPAELTRAWNSFDRELFGKRMFSGIKALSFQGTAGRLLTDIRGIEAADELGSLILGADPTCDLSPLAACRALWHLELHVGGRDDALEPLARIPSLKWLGVYNGNKLGQRAIDAIGRAAKVTQLALHIEGSLDLLPLLELRALERMQFSSEQVDAATLAGLQALLERGVALCFYEFEDWWRSLSKAVPGATVSSVSDYVVLCTDSVRAAKLDMRLITSSFFGDD